MKKYNILVVGAGSIGTRHIKNLLALRQNVIAVVEPSVIRRKQLLKEVSPRLVFFDTEKLAYADFSPDIVFICNPTALHISSARGALTHNAHVFIEKPLSFNLAGTRSLELFVRKKKKTVMVACNFRFHSGWKKLHDMLRKKKYGSILYVRVVLGYYLPMARLHTKYKKVYAASRRGGGITLDTGSHIIDYLEVLVGTISMTTIAKSRLHPLGIESDEIAHFFFRHKNGIDSVVSGDYVRTKPSHVIEVVTTKGTLVLDIRANRITFENAKKLSTIYQGSLDMNAMFKDELRHFFQSIARGTSPLQPLSSATRVVKILQKAKNI